MNENNKVYIIQDGTLKSDDIIAELKKYGGDDYYNNTADGKGVYFINTNHYNMIGWKDLKDVGELNAQGYTRIFLKSLERKAALVEGDSVKAQRTYNGDIVEGVFLGWHYSTPKMKEQGIMVGRVQVPGGKIYDVWPYPIEKVLETKTTEEAAEKALENYDIYGRCQDPHQVFTDGFCEGAEWANKRIMLKAEGFFKDFCETFVVRRWLDGRALSHLDIIEMFRKEMLK